MATPKLQEFDSNLEMWRRFVQHLELFFETAGIGADGAANVAKRRAYLLQGMGIELFNKFIDSIGGSITNIVYADIVTQVEALVNPLPLEVYERFQFHTRKQAPGESAADYLVALRKLALTCNFDSDEDRVKARLRDQFMSGLTNSDMQRLLLRQPTLTLENASQWAQSFETAEKTADIFNKGAPQGEVNAVHGSSSKPKFKRKTSATDKNMGKFGKCSHCARTNQHASANCPMKNATCYRCNEKRHITPACSLLAPGGKSGKSKKGGKVSQAAVVSEEEFEEETVDQIETIGVVDENLKPSPKFLKDVKCNGTRLTFEVDTGTGSTLINRQDWEAMNLPPISPTKIKFHSYSGHSLPVLGLLKLKVNIYGGTLPLVAYVVDGRKMSLLGRKWVDQMAIKIDNCRREVVDSLTISAVSGKTDKVNSESKPKKVIEDDSIKPLLSEFADLFDGTLGKVSGIQASLTVLPDLVKRKFWPPRPVPYALEKKVELELKRLENRGIIERIPRDILEYASPIVVVAKRGSDAIRICGDFKVSVNQGIVMEQYPLPKAEELFAKLGDCKFFTTLDLTEAYHQVELDEEAKKYLVINTKWGLFRYLRLAFGISSAPAIFQRTISTVLKGLPGVVSYLDDCLIAVRTLEEHKHRVKMVFQRFREFGIRLGLAKCSFGASSVKYLGHIIDKDGLHAAVDKIEAIQNAPVPSNITELQSFLGLVTYYGKFIKNQSTACAPLYELLNKSTKWQWESRQSEAFLKLKEIMSHTPVLCHYNPSLPIGLATDASSVGVGAVLFHIFPDGSEKPISYASQTLNSAQRNYAQIEKEAYGIHFGTSKFRPFLYGRRFTLVTDHKPLLALFGSDKPIPDRTSSRLQRWALALMGYTYDLQFKSTAKHGNIDALSRLPLPKSEAIGIKDVFDIDEVGKNSLSNEKLAAASRKDSTISAVIRALEGHWPNEIPPKLGPYSVHRGELAIENKCLFWNHRVIIPESMRKDVLNELHQGHPGMTRMKNLARSLVWWPGLDADIEKMVKICHHCQSVQPEAPAASIHPWEFPEKPWYRLHIDFAGPFQDRMWLIIVDARTKWPEVIPMKSATSTNTVNSLLRLVARFGVPAQIVSDNGSQFTSEKFRKFCSRFQIEHIRTSPYHPRSNGEAERFVRTFKEVLGKKKLSEELMNYRLYQFLLTYRNTTHPTTGFSPAKLLMNRCVRLPLDRLKSEPEDFARKSQEKQADSGNKQSTRIFRPGDTVWVRAYREDKVKWIARVILHHLAPLTYLVQVGEQKWRRHIDQLLVRDPECDVEIDQAPWFEAVPLGTYPAPRVENQQLVVIPEVVEPPKVNENLIENPPAATMVPPKAPKAPKALKNQPVPAEGLRRSSRVKKPVIKYDEHLGK